MKTKEITLCDHQVTIGYCYATEIAYKDLAGEDMLDYVKHAIDSIQQGKDPDAKRTIFAIIASMLAYYNSRSEEPPIKDTDLMNEATPIEIGTALGAILQLRADFYKIPTGEPEDKSASEDSNAGKGKGKTKN